LKFNAAGSAPWYATYWGGSGDDEAAALAQDPVDTVVIAGKTLSGDFPVSAGAFQTTLSGAGTDAFASRITVLPMPPSLVPDTCGCPEPGHMLLTAPGASGGNPAELGISESGVRYADGVVEAPATELESDGYGMPWGLARAWSNGLAYGSHG